jgi:hypothetical protein
MNIIHRRKAAVALDGASEEIDDRPSYLKTFPSPSSMLQDLQLGVLMGRRATNFHAMVSTSPSEQIVLSI